MSPDEVVIPSGNLSRAWALVFLRLCAASGGELAHPVLISIDEFNELGEPIEEPGIRTALDGVIDQVNSRARKRKVQSVSATASTIFPHMCWSPRSPRSADDLFAHYLKRVLPRLKELSPLNRRGTYFSRMIDATGARGTGSRPRPVNQLSEILRWWNRGHTRPRRSALQIGIYDPAKDHTGAARSHFPCLQQVSLGYRGDRLSVTAYYPTEYVFDRGYGNYLGLCQLGAFMAHEMRLRLERVNVLVALPELGNLGKGKLEALARRLRSVMGDAGGAPARVVEGGGQS